MSDPLPSRSGVSSDPQPDGDDSSSWLHRFATIFGLANGESLKERLERAVSDGEPDEGFSKDELLMLRNLMGFVEVRADDVMVPRADIRAIDESAPLLELVLLFSEAGHSRLPVYDGSIDQPSGMVHIKDLMRWLMEQSGLGRGADGGEVSADFSGVDLSRSIASAKITRPLLFAAPSEPAPKLLQRMQAGRKHMALVIDEFGATGGLVTIEDLIEEVFGEIEDEHAPSRPELERQEDGSYLADARLPLEELRENLDKRLTVPNENAHSLGGLILWTAGRLPAPGDRIPHTPSGFEFEVLSVHQHRISKVRIRRMGKNQKVGKTGVKAA